MLQTKILTLALTSLALVLTSCGSNKGSLVLTLDKVQSANQVRPLQSLWTETNNYFQMDLRTANLGSTSPVRITAFTGQYCDCQSVIQGSQTNGTMVTSSCTGTYTNCAQFNSSGTYVNSSSGLRICSVSAGCMDLR